jgi:hypothetical protein
VATLRRIGFLERDEASGWTWLRGFLQHNPIPNRNVGKAVEKQIDAVPPGVPFYGALIEALRAIAMADDKSLSTAFLDSMAERYRSASGTASRRSKTQTQTQIQTQDHDPSEAEASGAEAPRQAADLPKEIFDAGVKILVAGGKPEGTARSIVGKWRKENPDEAVLSAIGQAMRENATEPVAFITACLRAWHPSDGAPRTARQIAAEIDRDGTYDGVIV